MKKSLLLLSVFAFFFLGGNAQENITEKLFETYSKYKESSIQKRRIKHNQIQDLLQKYKKDSRFKVKVVGHSIEGRSISLLSIGSGKTSVFLWSQMHGNEPTATQAIFDILNFLESDDFKKEKEAILSKCTLHFLPMLNPDGAERYMRRNALGIDINRDALRLQSPEGQTLKKVRDSLEADFGFNLHDQSTYYNAELTSKPATISYLAPPFNYDRDINEVRGNAMKVIVFMNEILQKYVPGQVGRYSDDFEIRAFGDNIQKWGTSTILIESGGLSKDVEKQEIRKLNYVSILSAIYSIATENYKDISIEKYEDIPHNDRKLFDLKLEAVKYPLLGKEYVLDIGIHRNEIDINNHNDFYYNASIIDQGDLSTYFGYETFNAKGYIARAGKTYSKTFNSLKDISADKAIELLKDGYLYVIVKHIPETKMDFSMPIIPVLEGTKAPKNLSFYVGVKPNFFLEKNGELKYAVVNGFLIDLKSANGNFKNSVIIR